MIKPGEIAPTHRHSPAAIRLIIEGAGAYTTVDGEKCRMEVGDLILTPSMTWHDHGNESDVPMIWLDGLDVPFVRSTEAIFFDPYPDEAKPSPGRSTIPCGSIEPATCGQAGTGRRAAARRC